MVGVALSLSDRRRLAEIEKQLSGDDPHLATLITRWSAGHRRRGVLEIAAGVIACLAASVTGVALIDARGGTVLMVFGVLVMVLGVLALLPSLRVGTQVLWAARRRVEKRNAEA